MVLIGSDASGLVKIISEEKNSKCISQEEMEKYYKLEEFDEKNINYFEMHISKCDSCLNKYIVITQKFFEKDKEIIQNWGEFFVYLHF